MEGSKNQKRRGLIRSKSPAYRKLRSKEKVKLKNQKEEIRLAAEKKERQEKALVVAVRKQIAEQEILAEEMNEIHLIEYDRKQKAREFLADLESM